ERQRAPPAVLSKGLPRDEFAGQPACAVHLPGLVQSNDAGMLERRGAACLLQQALDILGGSIAAGARQLERDRAPELGIPRFVDRAEPAGTEEFTQLKFADPHFGFRIVDFGLWISDCG